MGKKFKSNLEAFREDQKSLEESYNAFLKPLRRSEITVREILAKKFPELKVREAFKLPNELKWIDEYKDDIANRELIYNGSALGIVAKRYSWGGGRNSYSEKYCIREVFISGSDRDVAKATRQLIYEAKAKTLELEKRKLKTEQEKYEAKLRRAQKELCAAEKGLKRIKVGEKFESLESRIQRALSKSGQEF